MRGATVIILLDILSKAHAKELAANLFVEKQDSLHRLSGKSAYELIDRVKQYAGNLVDNLVDELLSRRSKTRLARAKLDRTTLGRLGHFVASRSDTRHLHRVFFPPLRSPPLRREFRAAADLQNAEPPEAPTEIPEKSGGVADYIASLRWRAAFDMTVSLDKSQREKLLKKLAGKTVEDNEDEIRKSIGEAVATAKIEEAQRQKAKFDRERENLAKEAEKATRERVESDLLMQEQKATLEMVQKELEAEKVSKEAAVRAAYEEQQARYEAERESILREAEKVARDKEQNAVQILEQKEALETLQQELDAEKKNKASSMIDNEEQMAKLEREKETLLKEAEKAAKEQESIKLRMQEQQEALKKLQEDLQARGNETTNTGDGQMHHPLLGATLVDLGYKRVHLISAKALSAIPVWRKQRVYRHSRAREMAKDKNKTGALGLPGIIALHEEEDGQLAIVDGQHRVGMMQILAERDRETFNLDRILVEVFPKTPGFGPQDIFTEINKAQPVKLLDMPGVATPKERKIVTDAANKIEEKYSEMFKTSQQCRPPHINVDNLADALFASDVIQRHNIASPTAMMEWILKQNEQSKQKYLKEVEANKTKFSARVMDKAIKNEFFLGLDSAWLYN